jgi:hypothetical protein
MIRDEYPVRRNGRFVQCAQISDIALPFTPGKRPDYVICSKDPEEVEPMDNLSLAT